VLQDAVLDKLKSSLLAEKDKVKKEDRVSKIDRSLFTDREHDIMSLIAKGLSNREISKKLFISEGTIANHITSILSKTGLTHRTQIAIYFLTGEVN
jgi:DNA-binding NarL/FixJ family response regulator